MSTGGAPDLGELKAIARRTGKLLRFYEAAGLEPQAARARAVIEGVDRLRPPAPRRAAARGFS